MSRLESRAEVVKLSRELGVDPAELEFLTGVAPGDVRRLRHGIGDALHDRHRAAFQRAASASALLPTALTARLAQNVIGAELAAAIAAEMPPDRAAKLAGHLDTTFLADVCQSLDPMRAGDVVAAIDDEQVLAVAEELLRRREVVTVGRFVDVVSMDVLRSVVAAIDDDAALLEIAFATEAKHRLDDVVAELDDDHIAAIVETAVDAGLEDEALTLISHLGPESRRRVMDVVATTGERVVTALVEATHREQLWGDVLPLLTAMSPERQQLLAQLPVTRDPAYLRAIVEAARADDLWDQVLPMVALVDDAHVDAVAEHVADLVDLVDTELIVRLAETADELDLWDALLATLSRVEAADQRHAAEVLASDGDVDIERLLGITATVPGADGMPFVEALREIGPGESP